MNPMAKTKIFSVRATPELARRATELARQRGIGRSTLMMRLLERELAGAGDQPEQPAHVQGGVSDAR